MDVARFFYGEVTGRCQRRQSREPYAPFDPAVVCNVYVYIARAQPPVLRLVAAAYRGIDVDILFDGKKDFSAGIGIPAVEPQGVFIVVYASVPIIGYREAFDNKVVLRPPYLVYALTAGSSGAVAGVLGVKNNVAVFPVDVSGVYKPVVGIAVGRNAVWLSWLVQ